MPPLSRLRSHAFDHLGRTTRNTRVSSTVEVPIEVPVAARQSRKTARVRAIPSWISLRARTSSASLGRCRASPLIRLRFAHAQCHFECHVLPIRRDVPTAWTQTTRVIHGVPIVQAAVISKVGRIVVVNGLSAIPCVLSTHYCSTPPESHRRWRNAHCEGFPQTNTAPNLHRSVIVAVVVHRVAASEFDCFRFLTHRSKG